MLPDHLIRRAIKDGDIAIEPHPEDQCFQPASVDLRLGNSFEWVEATLPTRAAEWALTDRPEQLKLSEQRRFIATGIVIKPGQCVLACTKEFVYVSESFAARVEGKSTWGRRFLMVHSTAGFIDPGFNGQITLELCNLGPNVIELRAGEPIAQVSFQRLEAPARRPYGSPELSNHYQGQMGATRAAA